ncbi:hypothetical protein [Crateriforma conspicua]|nr:hypothetical protein [Crateriforma conspicua]
MLELSPWSGDMPSCIGRSCTPELQTTPAGVGERNDYTDPVV